MYVLNLFIHRFVVAMVYYGVFLSAPTVGGDIYLNFFLSSFAELPGIYLGIKAYNRYVNIHERRGGWWALITSTRRGLTHRRPLLHNCEAGLFASHYSYT